MTLCLVSFFIGTALVIFSLPFEATITNQGTYNTQKSLGINMPCSRVELAPAKETALVTTVTGQGLALVSHTFVDGEVRLRHIGLLRNLDCTIQVELAQNAEVHTPLGMPFMARNGVYPKNPEATQYRTFTRN